MICTFQMLVCGLNSTYASEEMCEFRGKLNAAMIKTILVRRVNPDMVSFLVNQFEERVNALKDSARTGAEGVQTAGLKLVIGTLHSDSHFSVPQRIRNFCKASLIEASKDGVCLQLLLQSPNRPNRRNAKRSARKSSMTITDTLRSRRRSTNFTFI